MFIIPNPIAGVIGASPGIPPAATGLIVTLTQGGFETDLLLIVLLGDLLVHRRPNQAPPGPDPGRPFCLIRALSRRVRDLVLMSP
jgi:hypothetical protein